MLSAAELQEVLRRDLMSFAHRAFMELNPQTPLLVAPHLELIATKLEACRQRRIRRLAILLPPRQLKSHMASIAFPAWYLGHHPGRHIICASYGQELADKLARDCRRIMASRWYKALFPTRLADRQAVHDFVTTAEGSRMATSVGGVLTGRGADLLILDDPLKPDEALSETRRNGVNEWFDHTLLSRLNDKAAGCIIIIMQRLHQDDLIGHVLEQEPRGRSLAPGNSRGRPGIPDREPAGQVFGPAPGGHRPASGAGAARDPEIHPRHDRRIQFLQPISAGADAAWRRHCAHQMAEILRSGRPAREVR
jgi:hypothetical protein